MPFFIPIIAIGAGVSLVIWGSRQLWKGDDSADQKAAEFISKVPEKFRQYVDGVSFGPEGVRVTFVSGTPIEIERAFRENVQAVPVMPPVPPKKRG